MSPVVQRLSASDWQIFSVHEAWCGVWICGVEGQCSFLVHSWKAVLIAGPSGFHTCFSVSTQALPHINHCGSPSSQAGLIVWITPCACVSLAPLVMAPALCRLELKTESLRSLLALRSVLMLVGFGGFFFLVFRYSVPFDNMLLWGKSIFRNHFFNWIVFCTYVVLSEEWILRGKKTCKFDYIMLVYGQQLWKYI